MMEPLHFNAQAGPTGVESQPNLKRLAKCMRGAEVGVDSSKRFRTVLFAPSRVTVASANSATGSAASARLVASSRPVD